MTLIGASRQWQPVGAGPHGPASDRFMGRGAAISGLIHVAIILAVIVTVHTLAGARQDAGVTVNIVGLSQYGKTAGAHAGDPMLTPPRNHPPGEIRTKPLAQDTVPPPPVPPPVTSRLAPTHQPPATVPPSATTMTATQALAHLPPHPVRPHTSKTMSEPPKSTLPVRPTASSSPDSTTHQPQDAKIFQGLNPSLQATLEKMRLQQDQDKMPTHPFATTEAGQPGAAGNPPRSSNSGLDAGERNAIGQHVRPCFGIDDNALGLSSVNVNLLVTTDAQGIVRDAVVAPQDTDKMTDARFAAFANRAIDAVMNATCATLPLPGTMLGHTQTLLFDFSP